MSYFTAEGDSLIGRLIGGLIRGQNRGQMGVLNGGHFEISQLRETAYRRDHPAAFSGRASSPSRAAPAKSPRGAAGDFASVSFAAKIAAQMVARQKSKTGAPPTAVKCSRIALGCSLECWCKCKWQFWRENVNFPPKQIHVQKHMNYSAYRHS